MRKLPYALALLGVVLLVIGLAIVGTARAAQRDWRAALSRDAEAQASSFGAALDRAGSVALLLAQSDAFIPDLRDESDRHDAGVELGYLGVLYSSELESASLVDERGRELVRMDGAESAPRRRLDRDVTDRSWFAPTMELLPGRVYQGPPYRSEESGQWVISTSTWITHGGAGGRLLVHIELDVDSFSRFFPAAPARHTTLVDGTGGHIVLEDGELALHEDHSAEEGWSHDLVQGLVQDRATVERDGDTIALARVKVLEQGTEFALNDGTGGWWAVTWSDGADVPPVWRGVVVAALGLLLVAVALAAFSRQQVLLRSVVRRDHLTGLVNRQAFEEALAVALGGIRSVRDAGRSIAVLLIDLDGFKQVNDDLGHDRGDQVLQEVARRLEQVVGERDTAARLGGDEFAVVLGRPRTADEVVALAVRLHDVLVRPYVLDGSPRFVGASVGVSLHPEHADNAVDLLRQADAAMYQAKRNHDGVRLYSPGTEGSAGAIGLAADLLNVLEDDRLRMVFQPQFTPEGGRIEAVAGLARWTAANGRAVPPPEFVALAEETGLIRSLTASTLRLALDAAAGWHAAGTRVPVSLNVSAAMLGDPALPELVEELLAERGLPGEALVFEVTGRAIAGGPVEVLPGLERLLLLGIRLRLDDFGGGHVSLAALRQLPVEAVKVDLASLAVDLPGAVRVLGQVVDLLHSLDLPVLVEGVEDQATWDAVRLLDCDGVQGFHLAPPMAATDVADLFRATPSLVETPVSQGM